MDPNLIMTAVSLAVGALLLFFVVRALLYFGRKLKLSGAPSTPPKASTFLALLIAAISPLGIPLVYIVLSIFGVCKGALGSGISCGVPLAGIYLESVAGLLEISFFFLVGFVWVIASFVIWVLLFWCGISLLLRRR